MVVKEREDMVLTAIRLEETQLAPNAAAINFGSAFATDPNCESLGRIRHVLCNTVTMGGGSRKGNREGLAERKVNDKKELYRLKARQEVVELEMTWFTSLASSTAICPKSKYYVMLRVPNVGHVMIL